MTQQQKIPEGWTETKLGNFCKFSQGIQIPFSEQISYPKEGYVRYLYIRDFFTEKYPHYVMDQYPSKKMNNDDLMMVNTGNTSGKVFSGAEGVLSNNAFKIEINKTKASRDYIWIFLTSDRTQKRIWNFFNVGGQPHVGHKNVSLIPVSLPPLPEQNRIVEVLETWDKYLEKLDQKIKIKKNIKKGLMQNLLTGKIRLKNFNQEWKILKLEEVLERISNGMLFDINNTEGTPVTRIETISKGVIDFNKTGYLSPSEIKLDYKLQFGDILYSHINSLDHIGKVAFFDSNKTIYHGMNLLLLRCNKKANSLFLYFWLCTTKVRNISKRLAKSAINQSSINTNDIKNIEILIPNIEEQSTIADILMVADKEIEILEKQREIIKNQKKYLLNNLITGQIRLPEFINKN